MVDYNKLRSGKSKPKAVDPLEIFRRLPKPPGINDLYTSQAEVLESWKAVRGQRDVVLKLHTGGGKTLVGLLMGQSTLNETREPVLYLAPTVQLVNQTIDRAKAAGIPAVAYEKGRPLSDDFVNANAIMVATYKALFNGQSKFGIRGGGPPQTVGAIILDDAHAAFSVIRESFTLAISASERNRYESLCGLFRGAFKQMERVGTFDDMIGGREWGVLEVPYWAWHEQLDAVREQLKSEADNHRLIWPLLRDRLHLCHALISRTAFTVTPILPLVDSFPTFSEAPRRIYMSATIADDSEIIRTFDADPDYVQKAFSSRSLAGVSERMVLIPDLMPFRFDVREAVETVLDWTANKLQLGAAVLVASDKAAEQWSGVGTVAKGSDQVELLVARMQKRTASGPAIFANRYDGIDLPGDSCRLLVMHGLPIGASDYELFRASSLYGGATITRMLAQRIEQGIGRGARGAGDHCVVVLTGSDLIGWVAKEANFKFLTTATRAQLEMGTEVSKNIKDVQDFARTIKGSYDRDQQWTEYHANELADLLDEADVDTTRFDQAATERKAFNLWADGYCDQAIARLEKLLANAKQLDPQTRGWMEQLAARIADRWGNRERAESLQRQAFAHNRNLLRPQLAPPYRPLPLPGPQERAIVEHIGGYRHRRGFLQSFEEVVVHLHHEASANQFEQALADLGTMLGFTTDRFDAQGVGPDVLWLLPTRAGLVIEAKSRKLVKNAFTKEQHGQLLVAAEWFREQYPGYRSVRVSVHPKNRATKAAVAEDSYALTYERLAALVSEARSLLSALCESQLATSELVAECSHWLAKSSVRADRIVDAYLVPFEEAEC
jgi:replicative superfamily II helicase